MPGEGEAAVRRLPAFDDRKAKKLLKELARQHGVEPQLILRLTEVVRAFSGSGRRHGINSQFDLVVMDYLQDHAEGE